MLGEGLRDALEVWSYVQSLPEPGVAILTMGKRDVSHDLHLPFPRLVFRPGQRPHAACGAGGLVHHGAQRPACLHGRRPTATCASAT